MCLTKRPLVPMTEMKGKHPTRPSGILPAMCVARISLAADDGTSPGRDEGSPIQGGTLR